MKKKITGQEFIEQLCLQKHPEGGYFAEVYRAEGIIPALALAHSHSSYRNFMTSIYFLLMPGQISRFHRLKSDELWYYHAGSSLSIHCLLPDGAYRRLKLGANIDNGASFQHVVPAQTWFGATIDEPDHFSLVGCAVAPGFDFVDFELGEQKQLLKVFPDQHKIISQLCA